MKLKSNFLEHIEHCEGFDQNAFIAAHNEPPGISIRINKDKIKDRMIVLDQSNLKAEVPWCEEAYLLKERPSFTLDPLFHAGAYYVQEASSMFLEYVIKQLFEQGGGYKALDMCAAPGGKSTLMAGLPQFGLLLSNEIIQSRVAVLVENMIKWGTPNVLVSNNDPDDFKSLPGFFDFVMVDAPCSGSGLFRKDEKAMDEWNEELVGFCAARQKRIVQAATDTLAEGGYLFYSTCSFSEEENEANLDFLMESGCFESIDIPIDANWQIVKSQSSKHQAIGYRFYPDKISGEGFFCGVLKKVVSKTDGGIVYPKSIPSLPIHNQVEQWVNAPTAFHYFPKANDVFAFDPVYFQEVELLSVLLKLRKSGIRLGEFIRNEFVPNHELAMSVLQSNQIPSIQLEYKQALQYLRRETIDVEVHQKGWALVQYKGVSLGWIKQVQGKAKNHYPVNWRILMRG